ncbi:MAG TPA: helix-turn-helix transcriptional regulator [Cytophagaceae bacterium]
MSKGVPLYSIDKFRKGNLIRQYEIEIFKKDRNFDVKYPHRHDFFEILFVTHGSGEHTIDSNKYEIVPNSIFFLTPGQIHNLKLSDDISGFIFLFTAEFYLLNKLDKNKLLELPFFFNITGSPDPLVLDKEDDAESLKYLFTRSLIEKNSISEVSEEIIRSILDIILLTCKKLYPDSNDFGKLSKGKLLVKRFKQLVEEKYAEYKSVKDYSEYLGVTASHLSETIKSHTGRTSGEIIRDKIILETKRLLIHTDLTISEICYKLNFNDQSYFSKYFKSSTGESPGDFRSKSIKIT